MDEQDPGQGPSADPPDWPPDRGPIYRSEELLQGHREIWIEHGNEMYRLRRTASGKLYLTK